MRSASRAASRNACAILATSAVIAAKRSGECLCSVHSSHVCSGMLSYTRPQTAMATVAPRKVCVFVRTASAAVSATSSAITMGRPRPAAVFATLSTLGSSAINVSHPTCVILRNPSSHERPPCGSHIYFLPTSPLLCNDPCAPSLRCFQLLAHVFLCDGIRGCYAADYLQSSACPFPCSLIFPKYRAKARVKT